MTHHPVPPSGEADSVDSTSPTRVAPDAKQPVSKGRVAVLIASILVLALVGGTLIYRHLNRDADTTTDRVPIWTPTPSTSQSPRMEATAKRTTTPTPPAPGCMAKATPITPTSFAIDDMKVQANVMSLGNDDSGAPAAPPKNASHSVGWWNKGPMVGADKGHAILTIHTYRQGGALGNELNSEQGLKPGMIVRLIDDKGQAMCYKYERALKVWVKDYDPNSNVIYDFEGKPEAAIVICWDFNKATEIWDSRIIFFLTPMS